MLTRVTSSGFHFSSLSVVIPPRMVLDTPFDKDGKRQVPVTIYTNEEQVVVDFPFDPEREITMGTCELLEDNSDKKEVPAENLCDHAYLISSTNNMLEKHLLFFPYKKTSQITFEAFKAQCLAIRDDVQDSDIEVIQTGSTAPFALQVIRPRKANSPVPVCLRVYGTKSGLFLLEDKTFKKNISRQTQPWFDSFRNL